MLLLQYPCARAQKLINSFAAERTQSHDLCSLQFLDPKPPIPLPKTCPCKSLHSTIYSFTSPCKATGAWGVAVAIYETVGTTQGSLIGLQQVLQIVTKVSVAKVVTAAISNY